MSAMSRPASSSDELRTHKQATLPPLWYKLRVVHRGSDEYLLSSHVRGSSNEALPAQSRQIARRVTQYLLHARRGEL